MRIRSIKPEFWRSDDIAKLDWSTRLVFIGLWSYVDDNGVGRDNERLITTDLFPQEEDPRETLATVSRALASLAEALLITRYTVLGKPFLHVTTWSAHQKIDRPGKPRYPLPTSDDAVPRDTLATPSREFIDIAAPGAGSSGAVDQGSGIRDQSSPGKPVGKEVALPRYDVESACTRLADHIEANGSKRPTITQGWRDDARKLIDLDKRDPAEIVRVMDWCQADPFWRPNVLSMATFRKKYDQLRLKAEAASNPAPRNGALMPGENAARILQLGIQLQQEADAAEFNEIGSAG